MIQILKKALRSIELIPYIFTSPEKVSELVFVTGADSSHYKSQLQFLGSLYKHLPDARVVVYDLGFTVEERDSIIGLFPLVLLRTFIFSDYPEYFNIKINAGEYAWKPVLFNDVLREFNSSLIWMDAGNFITSNLYWVRKIIKKNGFYSPRSSGNLIDWTHQGTLTYLNTSESLFTRFNLGSGVVGISCKNDIAKKIIYRWSEGAKVKECIAPSGSSRRNHRQDQAVLSVLAHQSGITSHMPIYKYGYEVHHDVD